MYSSRTVTVRTSWFGAYSQMTNTVSSRAEEEESLDSTQELASCVSINNFTERKPRWQKAAFPCTCTRVKIVLNDVLICMAINEIHFKLFPLSICIVEVSLLQSCDEICMLWKWEASVHLCTVTPLVIINRFQCYECYVI